MNLDLHTLTFVLEIVNLLQVIAILSQFLLNKNRRGPGWWLLWSFSALLGYCLLAFQEGAAGSMSSISIVLASVILLAGQLFLYIGVVQFLGRQESRRLIISVFTIYILAAVYFIDVVKHEDGIVLIYQLSTAVLSFLTAYILVKYKTRSILASANFLSGVFILNGCYFISQAVVLYPTAPGENALYQVLMQSPIFFEALITGILMAFGLIFMFNQHLNVENRESRENLEIIINTSPDAISVIRLSDGRFVDVNDGFIAMSHSTRAEILGRSTVDLNIWQNPEDRLRFDKSLAETGSCENQEIVFQRADGTQIIGLFFAKVINLQGVPHIISVVHDIDERKKTERELRKLTNVVEQSQSSVVITDTSGAIEYVNPKFCEITGYGFDEVRGRNPNILRTVGSAGEVYKELWDTITAGHKWQGRFHNQKKNGELFWESAIISPILDEHGVITNYVAVKEDITEQLLAEEALLKLAAVEERQRLARDLHDSVNQSIHGMVLFSETLVSTLEKNNVERARQIAERVQESARQALKETRLMLYQLQPSKMDGDRDLIRDLETRLLSVERHAGVRAQILQEGSMAHLPHGWHENLFWITIEALNNALKHAQARNIQIIVRCFPRHLYLEIQDDGRGFDPDNPHSGGLGLHNMSERAHLLGGELTILGAPGKGSKVCFSAEIKEA